MTDYTFFFGVVLKKFLINQNDLRYLLNELISLMKELINEPWFLRKFFLTKIKYINCLNTYFVLDLLSSSLRFPQNKNVSMITVRVRKYITLSAW